MIRSYNCIIARRKSQLDALEPVEKEQIPQGIKALGSHLFTVEKFTASGEHEKYKS
jgi:hypothetical protein